MLINVRCQGACGQISCRDVAGTRLSRSVLGEALLLVGKNCAHHTQIFFSKAQLIIDGRKSFPSGHSSTAFSGMLFLSLWIAGQTAAWAFSVPKAPGNWRSSRLLLFSLTLIPLFWATRVAISRVQDFVRIFFSRFCYGS